MAQTTQDNMQQAMHTQQLVRILPAKCQLAICTMTTQQVCWMLEDRDLSYSVIGKQN